MMERTRIMKEEVYRPAALAIQAKLLKDVPWKQARTSDDEDDGEVDIAQGDELDAAQGDDDRESQAGYDDFIDAAEADELAEIFLRLLVADDEGAVEIRFGAMAMELYHEMQAAYSSERTLRELLEPVLAAISDKRNRDYHLARGVAPEQVAFQQRQVYVYTAEEVREIYLEMNERAVSMQLRGYFDQMDLVYALIDAIDDESDPAASNKAIETLERDFGLYAVARLLDDAEPAAVSAVERIRQLDELDELAGGMGGLVV